MSTTQTRLLHLVYLVILLVDLSARARGQVSPFVGTWKNLDPNTRSVRIVRIDEARSTLTVTVWATCSPVNCPWGSSPGVAYSPSIQIQASLRTQAVTADFATPFARTELIFQPDAGDRLRAIVLTRYTDRSRRSNTIETALLARVSSDSAAPAADKSPAR